MSEIRHIFGEHDERTIKQLERCVEAEDGAQGVLCADGHLGYSAPIGGVVAYREHVSPAAVGYDIGCGNLAVQTTLTLDDLADGGGSTRVPLGKPRREATDSSQGRELTPEGELKNEASAHAYSTARKTVAGLMDRIFAEVSFGMGRRDGRAADHPVIDKIRQADFEPQRALVDDAAKQLGTVGAGNHYVDLFADEEQRIWIGVHFGSRGFGHKTASGFLAMAKGKDFTERVGEGEMESPPDLLNVQTEVGAAYLLAMGLAGEYAHAGREVVVRQVLDILGAEAVDEVHNHHNFAWREEHDGEQFYVVRKGATPAFPGQRGFVGATMGEPAVILEGIDSELSAVALRSTIHGAGRAMSRTKAAGKSRKRWSCSDRDCQWVQTPRTPKPNACPACGNEKLSKRWVKEAEGEIDWQATLADLRERNVELRGANAEEAPLAYKRLPEVLAAHTGTVRVLHTLTPLGVAMAPGEVVDPYKD